MYLFGIYSEFLSISFWKQNEMISLQDICAEFEFNDAYVVLRSFKVHVTEAQKMVCCEVL